MSELLAISLSDSSSDDSSDIDSNIANRSPLCNQSIDGPIIAALETIRSNNNLASKNVLIEHGSQAKPSFENVISSEIDYRSSRFQPKVNLTRLKKEDIDKYMNPYTNIDGKKALNIEVVNYPDDLDTCLDETCSSEGVLVIDLDGENSVCEEACQANEKLSDENEHVLEEPGQTTEKESMPNERQDNVNLMDYSSWQWNPKVQLKRLTDLELKNVERSSHSHKKSTSEDSWLQGNPIEFDKDESVIRELSPETATQQFQKVYIIKILNLYRMKT